LDVNSQDLEVDGSVIQQGDQANGFDLLDLTNVADLFTNFTNVQWIIVALATSVGMGLCWVTPCLFVKLVSRRSRACVCMITCGNAP
jgi:hypothetical protein